MLLKTTCSFLVLYLMNFMIQESICADAASFDLPASHLSACVAEARQCVDLALIHKGRDNSSDTSVDPENFAILKGAFYSEYCIKKILRRLM